jgi:endonuclease/exonuclease/phosphatase family metal-dependent hydrolase
MNTLRIATLNTLNLALPGRRIYEGWPPYTADDYLAKTQWLATMVDRLAADFVLVQEVFHAQALSDVVRQTQGQGRAWAFAAPLADEQNTRPRLGLLWRTRWQPQLTTIAELPAGCAVAVPDKAAHTHFSRPLLMARVPLPANVVGAGGPEALTLLNLHLKSRRPDFADGEDRNDPAAEARAQLRSLIMRGAEAAAVRRLVVEATRHNRTPLVVAGDFNDEPGAVTTQIIADTSWKREDHVQRDSMLFNALDVEQRPAPGRGRDTAFTILHAGEPERIDHVLVSEEFVPQSRHAIGHVERVEVLNDHLTERRRGRSPLAAGQEAADLQRILADHAAVCVSIVVGAPPSRPRAAPGST